jgi:hypothetical protein
MNVTCDRSGIHTVEKLAKKIGFEVLVAHGAFLLLLGVVDF